MGKEIVFGNPKSTSDSQDMQRSDQQHNNSVIKVVLIVFVINKQLAIFLNFRLSDNKSRITL